MQDKLALLVRTACWCMGQVFQPNDLGMNTIFPVSWHFECIRAFKNALWWYQVAGGAVDGPQALPTPQLLPSKMTPECGHIDVKYAHCSYHTRIGLGK